MTLMPKEMPDMFINPFKDNREMIRLIENLPNVIKGDSIKVKTDSNHYIMRGDLNRPDYLPLCD